ncbi:orange carotenoid protein N-terminal domain-containing protein [Anthocerotibacter panamensis]|uniref:orange carotenoid protein N-terminal domain-containing protein n=1 Tax=Anthocerotibacter panamensis TaxID=2857077 RepID=UPI001C405959|nr:orange carotenoid protein N-terminal domain-containing protein [Anthocerotibacter panamensis]
MTFTLESAQAIFTRTQAPSLIPATLALFNELNVNDQLAVLWYAYTEAGRTVTRAALGAARMELAEGLLNQIRQLTYPEQTKVMEDLARRADTPFSRAYGVFGVNTKLGFWYQLAEWMAQGIVEPMPADYQMSDAAAAVLKAIQKLDAGQQITVLRNAVVDMGYNSSSAPSSAPEAEELPFIRTGPAPSNLTIEGVTEPAVLNYIAAMNADDFEKAVALFTPDGALQPPFQKPVVGRQAIAAYMREEAQGLNMLPERGIVETLENGSKQIKVNGKVQTPWFGVNVAMNIAWRFAINAQGEIFFVAIDMLASPAELLNLRPS